MSDPAKLFEGVFERPFKGSDMLPPNATRLERVFMDALADIMLVDIPNRDIWNPSRTPLQFLPALAWGFSPDFWDDNWTEEQRRAFLPKWAELHKIKGTRAGIDTYIRYADSQALRWQVPPTGFFPGKRGVQDFTRLPKLRLYPYVKRGGPGFRFYHSSAYRLPGAFAGRMFPGRSLYTGVPILTGVIFDPETGAETPLVNAQYVDNSGNSIGFGTRGKDAGFFPGQHLRGRRFLLRSTARERYYQLDVRTTQVNEATIGNHFKGSTRAVQAQMVRLPGRRGLGLFSSTIMQYKRVFLDTESRDRRFYFEVPLFVPGKLRRAGVPPTAFAGASRLGNRPYHAEAVVEVITQRSRFRFGRFTSRRFLFGTDMSKLDRTLAAIRSSKMVRDRIKIDTQTHALPKFGDGFKFNDGLKFNRPVRLSR